MAMRVIDLDAGGWRTVPDFYDALLEALGAPAWHGRSIDALLDSMIWGGINAVEPPYTIRIQHIAAAPKDVADKIELVKQAITQARSDFQAQNGRDVHVKLETMA